MTPALPPLSGDDIATTLGEIDAMVRSLPTTGASCGAAVATLHALRCGHCGHALERPREPHAAAVFDLLCAWWRANDDADPVATD